MHYQKHKYPARVGGGGSARHLSALPKTRSDNTDEQATLAIIVKNAAFGLIGFLVCGLTLVTAACTAAYTSSDPSALIMPLGLAALMISCFAGGFVTTKLTRSAPMICGIVFGGLSALLMLAMSLIFSGAPSSHFTFFQGLLMHGFALLFSILGALTGNYKRKPDPRKRRFGN